MLFTLHVFWLFYKPVADLSSYLKRIENSLYKRGRRLFFIVVFFPLRVHE